MIRIRSRSDQGFRRAGVRHTPEPQTFPDGAFTPAQLEALKNESELVVEILRDPPVEERVISSVPADAAQEDPATSSVAVETPKAEATGEKSAAPAKAARSAAPKKS